MKNEYQLTPYKNDKAVGDTEYIRGYNSAIAEAKRMLITAPDFVDEVDICVIYNADDPESELSDVWYSVTAGHITKRDGGDIVSRRNWSVQEYVRQ